MVLGSRASIVEGRVLNGLYRKLCKFFALFTFFGF